MSDRPLQVGDLCEIVFVFSKENSYLVGVQSPIVQIEIDNPDYPDNKFYLSVDTAALRQTYLPWKSEQLRRIPPKSDPIADFQKCDDEFLEDMQRWLRVKV